VMLLGGSACGFIGGFRNLILLELAFIGTTCIDLDL